MKAITLEPLWAHLILCGEKTVLKQSWQTDYRGDLLICSRQGPMEPGTIVGEALCVVTLLDIVPFEKSHQQAAHMARLPEGEAMGYAWILSDLRYIKPFPLEDGAGLFTVEDERIHPCPGDATPEEYTTFFQEYYVPKFVEGPMALYEAFLCPVVPDVLWEDTEALGTLIQGVLPLPMPEASFKAAAQLALKDEVTNGNGVWCYRGSTEALSTFLKHQGMLTEKFSAFLAAYPDCAVAFQDNFYQ
ncbi:MAG: ASCH domain-containing protein [Eubacterium aggregans]|uniref:ASCH domain-containing protein n=1 Tax=Eubacterium aggregans TaxID=81409 RepID=UPI002B20958F|nr:ASCH domain-containing protein [Eubacterium aggregans]MEA5073396.1 ASCH domain-containing protein [Eubacterium aggregans]